MTTKCNDCTAGYYYIDYCLMHENAPKMLRLLAAFVDEADKGYVGDMPTETARELCITLGVTP